MFYIEKFQYIAKCILLSLPCFDFVSATTTETAQKLDYGNGEDKYILRYFTTNRYLWNLSVPTQKPPPYSGPVPRRTFQSLCALLLLAVVLFIVRHCLKHPPCKNCCASGLRSHLPPPSSNEFGAFQSSQESPRIPEELQRPPISNQLPDSRREQSGRPVLFNEGINNRVELNTIEMPNSFINSSIESPSQERIETDNTIDRNPPDYTMVILNDIINPSDPLYPCTKKDNETPPPEYGNEKQFFK